MTRTTYVLHVPARASLWPLPFSGRGARQRRKPPRRAAQSAEPLAIATAPVESRPIDRYLRVTGSLMADEQAESAPKPPAA